MNNLLQSESTGCILTQPTKFASTFSFRSHFIICIKMYKMLCALIHISQWMDGWMWDRMIFCITSIRRV